MQIFIGDHELCEVTGSHTEIAVYEGFAYLGNSAEHPRDFIISKPIGIDVLRTLPGTVSRP